ncbi:hypothetical protein Tco_1400781, partial [Tanacetum coccineum]
EGSRLKTTAKVAKSDKKKQPAMTPKAKGLNVLSKVALTEAEQMKLATKRSKTQFHSSHASGSGDGVDRDSDEEEDDDEDEFEDDANDNYDDGDDNNGNDGNDDDKADSERTESDREEIPNLSQSNVE